MKKILSFTLILTFWMCIPAFSEQIVIVNSSVTDSSIDEASLQKIYLGKKTKWDNGDKIVPVTLDNGPTHDDFLTTFVKKNSSQFSAYWKKQIFTGQGVPPKSVPSETDVVSFVSSTTGGIGYIDSKTPHEGVKVVPVE